MSGYNSEFESEGDWEDKGDLVWNEYDWQVYLKQNEQEMSRFTTLYKKMRENPNRLDEIARLMGWEREDWSILETNNFSDDYPMEDSEKEEEFMGGTEDFEPYTLHRHPVFIVTSALIQSITENYISLLQTDADLIDAISSFHITQALHQSQFQAIMAVNALDLGDFSLCVTHMKHAIKHLNQLMKALVDLPTREHKVCALFHAESMAMVFDLRDLWLRVINESREEHKRGFSDL